MNTKVQLLGLVTFLPLLDNPEPLPEWKIERLYSR